MKIWSVDKIKRVTKNFLRNPIAYGSSCIGLLILVIQEKRLGIKTQVHLFSKDKLYNDALEYEPTSYSKLKRMVKYLKLSADDTFIDLGCGAGRPVFFTGTRRLKKVIGVEIRKDLADIARNNLESLKLNNTPVEIINTDVSTFDVKDGTIFFMYNPFGKETFRKVIENIKKSLVINPRRARIAYHSPACRDLLDAQDWLVFEGEIDKTGILVWRSNIVFTV